MNHRFVTDLDPDAPRPSQWELADDLPEPFCDAPVRRPPAIPCDTCRRMFIADGERAGQTTCTMCAVDREFDPGFAERTEPRAA